MHKVVSLPICLTVTVPAVFDGQAKKIRLDKDMQADACNFDSNNQRSLCSERYWSILIAISGSYDETDMKKQVYHQTFPLNFLQHATVLIFDKTSKPSKPPQGSCLPSSAVVS